MYRVIIEEITEVTRQHTEWVRVRDPDQEGDRFGYTPPIEKTENVQRRIYEQTVESLDLANVVAAVNPKLISTATAESVVNAVARAR